MILAVRSHLKRSRINVYFGLPVLLLLPCCWFPPHKVVCRTRALTAALPMDWVRLAVDVGVARRKHRACFWGAGCAFGVENLLKAAAPAEDVARERLCSNGWGVRSGEARAFWNKRICLYTRYRRKETMASRGNGDGFFLVARYVTLQPAPHKIDPPGSNRRKETMDGATKVNSTNPHRRRGRNGSFVLLSEPQRPARCRRALLLRVALLQLFALPPLLKLRPPILLLFGCRCCLMMGDLRCNWCIANRSGCSNNRRSGTARPP